MAADLIGFPVRYKEGSAAMTVVPAHDAPETEFVSSHRVSCDGGEGGLGHPRVWIPIPYETGWAECGYCDKRFVVRGGPADRGVGADPD